MCPFARVVVLLCFVSSLIFTFFCKLLHFYLPATPILALSVPARVGDTVVAYFDVVGARTRAFGVKLLWLLCSDFLLVSCSFEVRKHKSGRHLSFQTSTGSSCIDCTLMHSGD